MEASKGPDGPSSQAPPGSSGWHEEEAPHATAAVAAVPNGRAQGWEPAPRSGMKHRSADRLCAYGDRGGPEAGGQDEREREEEGGKDGRTRGGGRRGFAGERVSASSSASSDDEGRARALRRAHAGWPPTDPLDSSPASLIAAGEPAAHCSAGGAVNGSAGKAGPRQRGSQKGSAPGLCPLPRGVKATSCSILLLLLLLLVLRLALERGSLAGITLHARSLEDAPRYIGGAPKDEGPAASPSSSRASQDEGEGGQKGQQLSANAGVGAGAGAEGEGEGRAGDADSATTGSKKDDESGEAGTGAEVGTGSEEIRLGAGGASSEEPASGAQQESATTAALPADTDREGGPVDAGGGLPGSDAGSDNSSHKGSSRTRYVWAPREGKFLLLFCIRGQISNRMVCVRNHVVAAALLNRTLIAPLVLPPALTRNPREEYLPVWRRTAHEPGYHTSIVWDIGRTRACLGPTTVVTDKEYYETHYYRAQKRPLLVDVIHCWSGPPESCGNSNTSATHTSDSAHVHNCPWAFGDPDRRFTRQWAVDLARNVSHADKASVSQWHVPYDSYLAPMVYPELAAAVGRGLSAAQSGLDGPGGSLSGLSSAAGAASGVQAGDGEGLRAPRLENSCLASRMSSGAFIAALGAVEDPVLVVGDMVNVKFTDRPQILPGPPPSTVTRRGPPTVVTSPTVTGARRVAAPGGEKQRLAQPVAAGGVQRAGSPRQTGAYLREGTGDRSATKDTSRRRAALTRSSRATSPPSRHRQAQRRLPQGPGMGGRGASTSQRVGHTRAKSVPLSSLFSRHSHQRRLLEEAATGTPQETPHASALQQEVPEQLGSSYQASEAVEHPRQSGAGTPDERRQDFCEDPLALLPARELISVSEQAKDSLLGAAPYLGIHWRRGDFGVYCFFHSPFPDACFYSPVQAGKCAFQVAQTLGLKAIFLATNAPGTEIEGFKAKLRKLSSGQMRVVQLSPSITSNVHKDLWPALQQRGLVAASHGGVNASSIPSWESQRKVVGLTLDKLIAARARVFLGSVESTFTQGIEQMRKSFGLRNSNDSYICFKELEWSIFEGLPKDLITEKKRRLKHSARREQYRRQWEAKEKLRRRRERMQRRKAGPTR